MSRGAGVERGLGIQWRKCLVNEQVFCSRPKNGHIISHTVYLHFQLEDTAPPLSHPMASSCVAFFIREEGGGVTRKESEPQKCSDKKMRAKLLNC
jgi:hypothetical protein